MANLSPESQRFVEEFMNSAKGASGGGAGGVADSSTAARAKEAGNAAYKAGQLAEAVRLYSQVSRAGAAVRPRVPLRDSVIAVRATCYPPSDPPACARLRRRSRSATMKLSAKCSTQTAPRRTWGRKCSPSRRRTQRSAHSWTRSGRKAGTARVWLRRAWSCTAKPKRLFAKASSVPPETLPCRRPCRRSK